MKVTLPYASFRALRAMRWPIYEVAAGEVSRVANSELPVCIYELNPPVAVATFRGHYPEAIEVTSMADASITNPNVTTEPTPNATAFTVSVTTITTAGTPQQLPSIVVPDGRALVVASDAGNNIKNVVYVATSSANALLATARVTLSPGNSVKLFVTNADQVWVNTDLNGQKVDVIVEQ